MTGQRRHINGLKRFWTFSKTIRFYKASLAKSQAGRPQSQPGRPHSRWGLPGWLLGLRGGGWMNGWMNGQTDRQKISPFYRNSCLIGEAALKNQGIVTAGPLGRARRLSPLVLPLPFGKGQGVWQGLPSLGLFLQKGPGGFHCMPSPGSFVWERPGGCHCLPTPEPPFGKSQEVVIAHPLLEQGRASGDFLKYAPNTANS